MDFEAIYEENFSRVYNFIYYRLLSHDKTDDLVSEVFTRVFEKLDSYDPSKAALSTWIFTIARNAIIDEARRKRPCASLDEQVGEIPADQDVALEYIKSEERRALRQQLSKLSAQEREIISMKFFEEKTNRCIAGELNMNESTVSSTVYNSMRKLRKGLDEYRSEGRVAL